MTRINTNVPSLVAQNRLRASNKDLQIALTRLSTGLRINTGADDPAGLIASEALRSEITSLGKAISNTRRASQIISTADSALGQVSNLLNDIRGLVVEAANRGALSDEEIAANQLQIDSSLEAINRIAQTTTFQGRKLLDGSLNFVSTVGAVGTVRDAKIDQANLGATGQIDVEVLINAAATQAELIAVPAAFTTSTNATASTADVRAGSLTIGGSGETLSITGGDDFATITLNDTGAGAGSTPSASFDAGTGVLTIDADFGTAAAASALDIQAAINSLTGFVASGATVAGDDSAPVVTAPSAAAPLIGISAVNPGADFNNVTVNFVSGTSNSADYDSVQKILTVTVDSTSPQASSAIAAAIDAHTVDGAAAPAALFTAGGYAGAFADINVGIDSISTGSSGGDVLLDEIIFQLNGANGAETFNFGVGTSATQIAAAVNLVSDSTGVSASYSMTTGLVFNSTAYGSDALVNIDVISEGPAGTFEASLSSLRSVGTDIVATVNGVEAGGDANTLSINTSTLDLTLTVDDGSNVNFSFSITDGGALFQLGPDVTSNQQARLGIGSVSTGQLGGPSGRLYELGSGQSKALDEDINGAGQIIDEVISKVTGLRGRLGAFQATTLESNLVSLNETLANLQEAESSIRDADFAQESANLTRAQILVQSGTNVLALANQNPQNVLALLRQ